MAKVKENSQALQAERVTEDSELATQLQEAKSERDQAQEGLGILQQLLDWCGEHRAKLSWREDRPGKKSVRVRVADLEIVQPCEDPIEGILEAVQLMQARMARRESRSNFGS